MKINSEELVKEGINLVSDYTFRNLDVNDVIVLSTLTYENVKFHCTRIRKLLCLLVITLLKLQLQSL